MRYFPDASEVGAFGTAFLRLMLVYSDLERRVADLQEVITRQANFGEKNQWSVHDRPKRMRKLIRENAHRLSIPADNADRIVDALRRAIAPCDIRNLLAHGHWWELDQDAQIITVRRGKLRSGEQLHVPIEVASIQRATDELSDIEVDLYKLQRTISVEPGAEDGVSSSPGPG